MPMFSLYRYSPLVSPTDKDASALSPSSWLRSRRVRNGIIVVIVLLILIFSVQHSDNLTPRLRKLYEESDTALFHHDSPPTDVEWSDYAYTQYVTNEKYLCNSLMIFEALNRLESKADRAMMYPQQWIVPEGSGEQASYESKLLAKARDEYKVKLVPIQVQTFDKQEQTWRDSFTKLLAFNQTQYKRVINVDSDSTIMQTMDELFFLPSAPMAMPRAYWLSDKPNFLSSQLLVLEPSEFEWSRIEKAIAHHGDNDFDMEIVNNLYGESSIMLPHRLYDLITGELRGKEHHRFLGSKEEKWNVTNVMEEVKFVHFSDWPYPKPWLQPTKEQTEKTTPACLENRKEGDKCAERDVWLGLYKDFRERRQRICGKEYDAPAPYRRSRRAIHNRRRPAYEPVFE